MTSANAGDYETVGSVARKLGLSVRTLHHWDHLGVASPSARTPSGYREYTLADTARLRRVMLLRDLGVPLREIPSLLSAPAATRRKELRLRQRELQAKILHLQQVEETVERVLNAGDQGVLLSDSEQQELFGPEWDPSWGKAARERWGDSAQWAEFAERSAVRSTEEWQQTANSMQEVAEEFAAAKRAGVEPGSDAANLLSEAHRISMSQYFHCTLSMQVLIARRYVTEDGFTDYYEKLEPGLAQWMKQVIDARAEAEGIEPESAAWE